MQANKTQQRSVSEPEKRSIQSMLLGIAPWIAPLFALFWTYVISGGNMYGIGGTINAFFIFSPFLFLLCGIGAIIVGLLALKQMKDSEQQAKGKSLTIAGVVTGGVDLLAGVAFLIILVRVIIDISTKS